MRRLLAVTVLLAACELPSGSLPPRVVPFDREAPQPATVVTQTFLTTTRDGAPVSTTLDLVLDTAGRRVGMRLGVTASDPGGDSVRVTTGADGLARVPVAYGPRAGTATLLLTTPDVGGHDAMRYELPAGDARRLFVWSAAAAYVGDTVIVPWETRDASGNRVFGSPSVTVADTTTATLLRPDAALALRTGATWARVSQGTLTDSAAIAIVPHGRLGARAPSAWTAFDLDGTARDVAFGTSTAFAGPRYSPSGDTLAYTDGANIQLRTPGPATSRLVPAALGFTFDRSPCWSGDGAWIYFTAVWYAVGRSEIWRIHPDGTGAERVGPAAAAGEQDDEPSVGPGGTLLAFTTNRTLDGGAPTVRIVATATGTTVWSGPAGAAPRFSPDGATLAFLSGGTLRLVGSDGTGLRSLTADHVRYSGQLAWSPDGRWLAVAHTDTLGTPPYLHVVDTAGNVAIRLPYAFGWTMPDWIAAPSAPAPPARLRAAPGR